MSGTRKSEIHVSAIVERLNNKSHEQLLTTISMDTEATADDQMSRHNLKIKIVAVYKSAAEDRD